MSVEGREVDAVVDGKVSVISFGLLQQILPQRRKSELLRRMKDVSSELASPYMHISIPLVVESDGVLVELMCVVDEDPRTEIGFVLGSTGVWRLKAASRRRGSAFLGEEALGRHGMGFPESGTVGMVTVGSGGGLKQWTVSGEASSNTFNRVRRRRRRGRRRTSGDQVDVIRNPGEQMMDGWDPFSGPRIMEPCDGDWSKLVMI